MTGLEQLYVEHCGKVSDKWRAYFSVYDHQFARYRNLPIRLLEIGVQNGGSLELLSKYFPNAAKLIGCDIDPNCGSLRFEDARIAVVVGDVNTDESERRLLERSPEFDVIIDDGSHCSQDTIRSFARYFRHLSDDGIYIFEDLHCSYWQEYQGGLFDPLASMTFLKCLTDVLNHEHWGVPLLRTELVAPFARHYGAEFNETMLAHVHSVTFFNSVCVIGKREPQCNVIGRRFIAGGMAETLPGLQSLHDAVCEAPDQRGNPTSAAVPTSSNSSGEPI